MLVYQRVAFLVLNVLWKQNSEPVWWMILQAGDLASYVMGVANQIPLKCHGNLMEFPKHGLIIPEMEVS